VEPPLYKRQREVNDWRARTFKGGPQPVDRPPNTRASEESKISTKDDVELASQQQKIRKLHVRVFDGCREARKGAGSVIKSVTAGGLSECYPIGNEIHRFCLTN